MSLEELFDYIVDPTVTKFNRKERLKVLEEAASNRYYINKSHRLRSEEKLFESYVTNCRNEVRLCFKSSFNFLYTLRNGI